MEKTIKIGEHECNFKTSAAVPRMYRLKFGRDIFNDLNAIDRQIEKQKKEQERRKKAAECKGKKVDSKEFESSLPVNTLTTFENIAFIMHKHGDPSQPKEIDEWLEQFETFDIYQIFPEIIDLWNEENKRLSVQKKEVVK